MPCYRPLNAFRHEGGDIGFSERPKDLETLELGCGRCVGCRLTRASSWAVRCSHEAQLYDRNCFVTLSYADEHLPKYGSLRYEDVQAAIKRLRKRERGFAASPNGKYPIRFFLAGEYGGQSWRPHYHALFFNFDFEDKFYWRTSESGFPSYRSPFLEDIWKLGSSEIGSVTPQSAGYVAQYSLKKVMGRQASEKFYSWVDSSSGEVCEVRPEFCVMSRRPGLGAWWLDRYESDVLPRDYCIVDGRRVKVPRFYLDSYARRFPELVEQIKYERYEKLKDMPLAERSEARRHVSEAVAVARHAHFQGERGN